MREPPPCFSDACALPVASGHERAKALLQRCLLGVALLGFCFDLCVCFCDCFCADAGVDVGFVAFSFALAFAFALALLFALALAFVFALVCAFARWDWRLR